MRVAFLSIQAATGHAVLPTLRSKHVLSASALPPIMEAEIMDPARRPSTPHRLRFGQLGVLVVPKAVKLGGGWFTYFS